MMNEDENSMLFESIEQLTNTLDAIEKQKQLFVQSFNQLKLREAELSHKLDAYKNGTQDSLVDCVSFSYLILTFQQARTYKNWSQVENLTSHLKLFRYDLLKSFTPRIAIIKSFSTTITT